MQIRKFSSVAATVAVGAALVAVPAPAQAWEVTPSPGGGCTMMATEGDQAVMREYDEALVDNLARLLKERVPGVSAEVDMLVSHGRATATQLADVEDPAHIRAAMGQIDTAATAAGWDEYDYPAAALLGMTRGADYNNWERLVQNSGKYGFTQASLLADETSRGDHLALFYQSDVNRFITSKSQPFATWWTDADVAAAPQADKFQRRTHQAFVACRDGEAVNDGTAPFPPNEWNIDGTYSHTGSEDWANSSEALNRGDVGAAVAHSSSGVWRAILTLLNPIIGFLSLPFLYLFLNASGGSS